MSDEKKEEVKSKEETKETTQEKPVNTDHENGGCCGGCS